MWVFDSDYNKWVFRDDKLAKTEYDYLKQELVSTRLYSKCLSGATYIPINNLDNIYDILGEYEPRNWYISNSDDGSQYSETDIPKYASAITNTSKDEYYDKYISEYGLTLKNLFTPDRLIKDSINYIYVDVATADVLGVYGSYTNLFIDGVKIINGHRILVKNEKTIEVLPSNIDPEDYFVGNYTVLNNYGTTIEYEYYNSDNGIYVYKDGLLIKTDELDDYSNCIRYSVSVKLGTENTQRQYHLSRLLNGYYPTSSLNEPMEFVEKHNWLLRHRVDYNNLFEINYHSVIKHATQKYNIDGVTYSIPERTISVGEFGVILNTQFGVSNLIENKYKVDLRDITETEFYYWICGDDGVLLKVRKHDYLVDKVEISISNNFKSVSFIDNLNGVIVGDLNTILLTNDGGVNWFSIVVDDFESYFYNKVLYRTHNNIYIVGKNGVFIELSKDAYGWSAYKRRISKYIDSYEEHLLVDDINDIFYTKVNWALSYSYPFGNTQSTALSKEILLLVTDDNKVIINDLNDSVSKFDFLYLDIEPEYGNILDITQKGSSNVFVFTCDKGIFNFNISNYDYIGIDNEYSNTITKSNGYIGTYSTIYVNDIKDYNGTLTVCGNTSLLEVATYSTTLTFNKLDENFESRLKPKMLFVDYDIASKLNFFTDFGDYRLPNSITVSSVDLKQFSFTPLEVESPFNDVIKKEVNWFSYWKDTEKTFEYYSDVPFDESAKIEISDIFTFNTVQSYNSFNTITDDLSLLSKLAPSVLDPSASKFTAGTTPIISPVISSQTKFDIYLNSDILIIRNYIGTVNVGDVIRMESDVIDCNFVVNKIEYLDESVNSQISTIRYIYVLIDLNGSIINDLKKYVKTANKFIKFTNLNIFDNLDTLKYKFNLHPISSGYNLDIIDNSIVIKPLFNNITSYYNLATNVTFLYTVGTSVDHPMVYTDGFLKFGYTPTYNILDYLESLNDYSMSLNAKFTASKEYLAMPVYKAIPMQYSASFNPDVVYFDYNGVSYNGITVPSNKLLFGSNLSLEWESIFINTFVDVKMYSGDDYYTPDSDTVYFTERLLVMKKYIDKDGYHTIEFDRSINFPLYTFPRFIDIISRRTLLQISSDLQELNNIQRSSFKAKSLAYGSSFKNNESSLNFKISTDSYTKVLLSDVDTVNELSSVIYTDYKNELAMNITRIDRKYNITINDTDSYNGKLLIICASKHGLKNDDGVVLTFNGGVKSSEYLNQNWMGYHNIKVVDEYKFYIPYLNFVNNVIINDTGVVRFDHKDPFLNYQPIDIIDVGVDKKGKIAIELKVDNLQFVNEKYSLINVDFNNYRFRLIDGLNIEILSSRFPWILEAEISGAVLGMDSDLIWYKGTWACGRWFSGTWISGDWKSGDWYNGSFQSHNVTDNILTVDIGGTTDIKKSIWYGGRFYNGDFTGTWVDGRFYNGDFTGNWYGGIWNFGNFKDGLFSGGVWVDGNWDMGTFNCDNGPAYWLNGKFSGGDFENGMWYNGVFEERKSIARFGTKAYNSRTANWKSGKWLSGSFYSRMITDNNGIPIVSESHIYSIWGSGTWYSGDFYGGIVYNIDFQSGTWYGGILEDIHIIGINNSNIDYTIITLNGRFRFNIGDEIVIGDVTDDINYSKSKVINYPIQSIVGLTVLFIEKYQHSLVVKDETNLRVISRFRNANWLSGIWTNGLFENGVFNGGIWYNGIFNANWM